MKLFEAGHEIKYLVIRRVPVGMILLCGPDNDVDDIGKTSAAPAALFHRMVNFRRHDQLPTVLIEHLDDGILYVLVGYEIAATNQHLPLPVIRNALNSFYKAKADIYCQQKTQNDIPFKELDRF